MIGQEIKNDETKLTELLGSLPRVDAPNDFDFRVKARIASGVKSRGFRLVPAIGLAAPAIAAVGIGAYWFMQPAQTSTNAGPQIVASESIPAVPTVAPALVPEQTVSKPEVAAASAPAEKQNGISTTAARRNPRESVGGSVDSAASAVRPVLPHGIPERPAFTRKPADMQSLVAIPARDVLISLGTDVEFVEGHYRVSNIRSSSVAEQAGLRTGDVIESINDKKVEKDTAFKGVFSSRSVRVRRDGKSVEIKLERP